MPQQDIKSAHQVVSDFLDSLTLNPDLDPKTVAAITKLQTEGKLTNTRLVRTLDDIRQEALSNVQQTQNKGAVLDD